MSELFRSFRNAGRGIVLAGGGRNFRIELLAMCWALLLCWIGGAGRGRWAAVILACALVLAAECFNTALEVLCDRVTTEKDESIRAVKDMAAGAVLLCAIGAVGVAVCAFCDGDFWKGILDRILYEGQAWVVFLLLGLPVAAISVALPPPKRKRAGTQNNITVEEIEEEDGNH